MVMITQKLELYIEFYNDKVDYIRFDINNSVTNADWYKDLGQPFAVSGGYLLLFRGY